MSPSPRPRSRNGWRALLDEARRREVPRALLLYGGVAWATVTASPDLIQWLGAPTWIFGALVLALALGLPVVLWASWTLDFSVRAEAEWPGGDLAPAGEDVEELTPADVERIGFGRREKLLGLAIPVVLLFVFPFLVRWAVTPEPGAGLTVAIQASEGTASVLGPPLEWFLDARTVMVVPGSGSLEEALAGARRVGARYLVRGDSVSALLFEVDSGARMEVLPGGGLGAGAEESAGRLSVQLVRAIAEREGRALPVEPEVISHTSSPVALLHLMEGRRHFGHAEFEDAMAAYRLSVEADSAFVPAYYRLAVAHQWLWSYDVGWDVLARGSVRGDPSPRWARLLEAGRRYLERDAARTLASFEEVTLHNPELREGWLGLGEALFHYGGVLGLDPQNAARPLERALDGDSLFAPVGHHLVELALWRDDPATARRALRWMAPAHPVRPVLAVAIDLEHGTAEERAAAWDRVRSWDLRLISLLAAHSAVHPTATGRARADSLAGVLLEAGRRPEERLRGAQYRLMLADDSARWEDALTVWRSVRGVEPFDSWAVHAHQAGRPIPEAEAMLAWAEEQRRAGTLPDFRRSVDDELRQAFNGLVHEAVLRGDSARVEALLASIEAAGDHHPTDPGPPVLTAALEARLALLAADTTTAVEALTRATARTFEPFMIFDPLNNMAPERALLIRLHEARGQPEAADRWRASFTNSLSFGDLLHASWMDAVADRSPRTPPSQEEP